MLPINVLDTSKCLEKTISDHKSLKTAYQTYLKQEQDRANQFFLARLKQPNQTITHLLEARSCLIDQIIQHAWSALGGHQYITSLIAVGGYGRALLHPHSDIDILILIDQENDHDTTLFIQQFLTLMWDLKLKLGHSVRPIEDCLERAKKDSRIYTSLLETRFIAGNQALASQLLSLFNDRTLWSDLAFIKAKIKEQKNRHQKYHETGHNLEPNVKGSPGGLRDLQVILWITKHYFGTDNLGIFLRTGFLREEEIAKLQTDYNLLLSIRYGLHLITHRSEDRLLFDHQKDLAKMFGFQDNSAKLAVEQFMQSYYQAVFSISSFNELIIQQFYDNIFYPDQRNHIPIPPHHLNRRFQILNFALNAQNDDIFKDYPEALIEVFLLAADQPELIKGIHASLMRLIRDHTYLIDEAFRNNTKVAKLFIRLMQSNNSFNQLRRMRRYGVLGRYLPEFEKIIGQMQHDLFHVYTVDAHTLQVIRHLNSFHKNQPLVKHQPVVDIFQKLSKPEIVYIAALYHDIAKGRGGDHSLLGVIDAKNFCLRHRLSEQDTKLVTWLVKHHLLLSQTAQNKDISDPNVIQAFARKISNTVQLDHLYVLTIADVTATNPTLWSSWRETLFYQTYTRTKLALKKGLDHALDKDQTIDNKRQMVSKLIAERVEDIQPIQRIWDQLDDIYFLQFATESIVWHSISLLNQQSKKSKIRPVVSLTSELKTETGGSHILLYSPKEPINFIAVLTAFEQLGLNIQELYLANRAHEFDLNFYTVLEFNHQPVNTEDTERIKSINQLLKRALISPQKLKAPYRRLSRRARHFNIKTQTSLSCDIDNSCCILELRTTDRPGLLAEMARIFEEFNVYLENAKIATLGDRVEDVFFITTDKFTALSDPEICAHLIRAVEQRVDSYLYK